MNELQGLVMGALLMACTQILAVGLVRGVKAYRRPDRVLLRAARRTAKRIRKLDERIERREREMNRYHGDAFAGDVIARLNNGSMADKGVDPVAWPKIPTPAQVGEMRACEIARAVKDLDALRKDLDAAVVEWKGLMERYHQLCPPPAPDETSMTYRVTAPKVRVAPVIEETEELLERMARKKSLTGS